MRHMGSLRGRTILASAVLAVLAGEAKAQSNQWINPSGGSFWDGSNWSAFNPPYSEAAEFRLGSADYTVSFAAPAGLPQLDANSGYLLVYNDSVTLDLRPVPGSPNPYVTYNAGWLHVGMNGGHASLTTQNGRLVTTGAIVGGWGTVGLMTLNDTQWTNNGNMNLGITGVGRLTVASGASIETGTQTLGDSADGNGTLIVDGPGSRNVVTGELTVANGGTGLLNVANGGFVRASNAYLGRSTGTSTTVIDGPGSKLSIDGSLYMSGDPSGSYYGGQGPTSSLTIRNGAAATVNGEVRLGAMQGGAATLNVDGAGSSFAAGYICLGDAGSAWINVTNGGSLSATDIYSASEASINVEGSGSRLTLHSIGLMGGSSLTVSDAAQVVVDSGQFLIGGPGQASVTVDHASISGSALDLFSNGTLLCDSGTITMGQSARLEGVTQLKGNSLLGLNSSYVLENLGDLEIADSSTLSAQAGVINNGTIFMNGRLSRVVGYGTLYNYGVVQGTGTIQSTVVNFGDIRAEGGESLSLAGSNVVNERNIQLLFGGTVSAPQGLWNNNDGVISGDGVLRVGRLNVSHSPVYGGAWESTDRGLFNYGKMNFSGTTKVYGDVWHQGGDSADIIASGGATLTFYNDVYMQDNAPGASKPEIRAGAGSRIVYFGLLKGDINLTGTGTHQIEGTLSPGFSPGYVSAGNLELAPSGSFGFDLSGTQRMDDTVINRFGHYSAYDITGTLTMNAGGTVDVNLWSISAGGPLFSPQLGDSFELIRWAALAGDPSLVTVNLDGAVLGDGLSWQVTWGSAANGSLVLAVVPEPGMLLFGVAVAGPLALRRRRLPLAKK